MAREPMEVMERTLKALADRTRLRILALLAGGEVCVCHIYDSLQIPQPKASRHLAYLRRAGLVEARKDGLWVHYRLARPRDAGPRALLAGAVASVRRLPAAAADRARLAKVLCAVGPRTNEART